VDAEHRIADLEAQIAAKDARIAEQDARIAEQDVRIAELEKKLAALIEERGRNSSNSNLLWVPETLAGLFQKLCPVSRWCLQDRLEGGGVSGPTARRA